MPARPLEPKPRRTGRTPRAVSGDLSEACPSWVNIASATTRHPKSQKAVNHDATMPECASGELSEAGHPKTTTTGVEWPPDPTESENPAVALALTRLTLELSRAAKRRRLERIVRHLHWEMSAKQ